MKFWHYLLDRLGFRVMNFDQTTYVDGYMCLVDWEHHAGNDALGNRVFWSIESLKEYRRCVDACGIVKVRVTATKIMQPQRLYDDEELTNGDNMEEVINYLQAQLGEEYLVEATGIDWYKVSKNGREIGSAKFLPNKALSDYDPEIALYKIY